MNDFNKDLIAENEELERKWRWVAEKRDFRCSLCGNYITHAEKDVYFFSEHSYCGGCEHVMNKED